MITLTGAEKAFVKIQCQLKIKISIKLEIHENLLNLTKNIQKPRLIHSKQNIGKLTLAIQDRNACYTFIKHYSGGNTMKKEIVKNVRIKNKQNFYYW